MFNTLLFTMLLIVFELVFELSSNNKLVMVTWIEIGVGIFSNIYPIFYFLTAQTSDHLKFRIALIKPFRLNVVGRTLLSTAFYTMQQAYEPIVSTLIVAGFMRWENSNSINVQVYVITFYVFRLLSKVSNAFSAGTYSFLVSYFEINKRVGNMHRV